MTLRNANLDLLRASAIILVLVHHIGQFSQNIPSIAHRYTSLGAYGVDLFFVLSGWLIGSLYWKEKLKFGDIDLILFWSRRWLRTIPPYIIVLPIAYAGVYFARNEPFNLTYLVFFQNYESTIPFFVISWSLCVEEHFYLLMPVIMGFFVVVKVPLRIAVPTIMIFCFMARFIDPLSASGMPFGYSRTASHLNFAGLMLGVWFSYLNVFYEKAWKNIQRGCRVLLVPLFVGFLLLPFFSEFYIYYFGSSLVAILWGVVLASITAMQPIRIATFKVTYMIALTSYSVYLTHGIVLHVCVKLSDHYGLLRELVFPLWVAAIVIVGYVAFVLIEKPAILFRDKIVPRRSSGCLGMVTK